MKQRELFTAAFWPLRAHNSRWGFGCLRWDGKNRVRRLGMERAPGEAPSSRNCQSGRGCRGMGRPLQPTQDYDPTHHTQFSFWWYSLSLGMRRPAYSLPSGPRLLAVETVSAVLVSTAPSSRSLQLGLFGPWNLASWITFGMPAAAGAYYADFRPCVAP